MLAISEFELGRIYDSEKTAVEALELIDRTNIADTLLSEVRSGLYNHLGLVHETFDDYESALRIYDKALKLVDQLSDSLTLLNNKALVYKKLEDYVRAETYLQLVYDRSLTTNNRIQIARAQDNLGFVQSKLNKTQGLSNMLDALDIRIQEKDQSGLYANYNHLSLYYKDRNDIKMALKYAELAKEAAKVSGVTYKMNALSHLLAFSEDPNVTEYLQLSDSIAASKQKNQNSFAAARYNLEKEQQLTRESELQRKKEKRLKLLYLALGLFILMAATILYFILKTRHKKEKIKQVYETETRISKKLHDEVANDVYHVMTKLQGNANQNVEVLDDLEGIYTKTRDISKESAAVNVQHNFDELLNDLLLSYKNEAVNIITRNNSKIDWEAIPDVKKITIYRVLQELMTNMKKHSEAGLAVVKFSKKGSKLQIDYSDNGKGCYLKKKSGLLNTENRIETIGGHINFESEKNKGFKAFITI
jgi:signal transduction histidine kinase